MFEPRLKNPPFSRHAEVTAGGCVFIYCGSRAYTFARPSENRGPSIVYPRRSDPAEYRWPVEGMTVVVFPKDEDEVRIHALIIELLNQGAERVWLIGAPDGYGIVQRQIYDRPQ